MTFQDLTTSSLTTYNPIFDTSILFPKGFWEPGWASIYKGFFGAGSFASGAIASASFGPGPTAPISTYSTGIDLAYGTKNQFGVHLTDGAHTVLGIELRSEVVSNSFTGASSSLIGEEVTITGGIVSVAGAETVAISGVSVELSSAGGLFLNARNWDVAAAFWDSKKPFDIPHPSKENHRLRYVCAEGPSADVFVRGKLKGSNVIELPDYWKDLVDEESITINLTPISQYQELFIVKIEGTKIHVRNNSAGAINCSYVVYGERKDTSKNISEYEGTSPSDYPGDNREYIFYGAGNYWS
jgi:hypothetical protein